MHLMLKQRYYKVIQMKKYIKPEIWFSLNLEVYKEIINEIKLNVRLNNIKDE